MRRDDPNREYLLLVASALGDLCNEAVFVSNSSNSMIMLSKLSIIGQICA